MRFIVTAVTISRRTRRRVGKHFTEIVTGRSPADAERRFEFEWNARPGDLDVKVVDVRTAHDRPRRRVIPEGGAPLT